MVKRKEVKINEEQIRNLVAGNPFKQGGENTRLQQAVAGWGTLLHRQGTGRETESQRRSLQDYRNNGILPYTRIGGRILYRASDIERTLMHGYMEAYRLNG